MTLPGKLADACIVVAMAMTVSLGAMAYSPPARAGVSLNFGHHGLNLGYRHHNYGHGYRHGFRNYYRPHRYFGRHHYRHGYRHYRPYRHGYDKYGYRF